ncbi:trypsin-like serine peptidase [Haliea sp. E17]|uniref:trypsin-like serine peptidase n=1 Tax=Haliea sp. E17 TaxID=3401576 RepID=UPI003AAD8FA3
MSTPYLRTLIAGVIAVTLPVSAFAQAPQAADRAREVAAVKAFWTASRIAAAQPRDLVLDGRGLAYLRGKGGKLTPYGHSKPALPEPLAKGGGGGGGGGKGGGKPGGGSGGSGFDNVVNAQWTNGGTVQTAAGRILFVMGTDYYVCSGTLVNDGETSSDRSIILTAAHCVYDDVAKAFARSAIFIPNQAGTSGAGTDFNCANDPEGCWVADFGVVSKDWDAAVFPANIPWDYGFYAMGTNTDPLYFSNDGRDVAMDKIITPMEVSFAGATLNTYTRALGYSYSDDPNFMYCGEPVTGSSYDGLLLPNCGMSGGASGGPWSQSQAVDLGTGPVISVNSYGPAYGKKYMGGPRLDNNDAQCLFETAKKAPVGNTTGIVDCLYSK